MSKIDNLLKRLRRRDDDRPGIMFCLELEDGRFGLCSECLEKPLLKPIAVRDTAEEIKQYADDIGVGLLISIAGSTKGR